MTADSPPAPALALNPILTGLPAYPFGRLRALLDRHQPGAPVIDLSIGEPQRPPPPLLTETLAAASPEEWRAYPPMQGTPAFRAAAAGWLRRRFNLAGEVIDPERMILPCAGTREALYLIAQTVLGRAGPDQAKGAALIPDPGYAVYQGASLMAGGEAILLPATRATNFLPDLASVPADIWARTSLIWLCSPSNPQGTAADMDYWTRALALARQHDAVLVADECYAALWQGSPSPGVLEAAAVSGSLANLLSFHSLSKRSNAAGLRSGFVVGDPALIAAFAKVRSYAAATSPLPVLAAAAALWGEDSHVADNRSAYLAAFELAEARLAGRHGFYRPDGGFFAWLEVGDGEAAALKLWREGGLRVLPGKYLTAGHSGAGDGFIRLALVHDPDLLVAAFDRLTAILG